MTVINVLHLSDIHFGHPDPRNEHEGIISGVTKALRDYDKSVDLIVFTGDLTQRGEANEYERGRIWLEKIQKLVGGSIVICPGNHDMQRSKADVKSLKAAASSEELFNLSKPEIYKTHAHGELFLDWYKEVSEQHGSPFLSSWEDNIFGSSACTILKGCPTKIVCVNTAALSCDDNDLKNLALDVATVNSGLSLADSDSDLVLCIGHHPIEGWLTEWNSKEFAKILKNKNGAHMYFHGHLHDIDSESKYSGKGSGILSFSAGAIYQGSDYPQSFSVIEIDLDKSIVTPNTYKYSNGAWFHQPSESQPIPATLPKVDGENINAVTTQPIIQELGKWSNPFDKVASNSLDAHLIPKLFVDENNFINRVSKIFESLIEGQRGTGKTMLLRFLSINVQATLKPTEFTSVHSWITNERRFVGVYIRLSTVGFNRSDLEAVASQSRRQALFSHRVTLYIISNFMPALTFLLDGVKSETIITAEMSAVLSNVLQDDEIKKCSSWSDLETKVGNICDEKIEDLDEHLNSLLPGGTPTSFNPRLGIGSSLKRVFKTAHKSFDLQGPFFILLDDFDTLDEEQQGTIFTVARERDHELVCYKYGLMTLGQKNFMAGIGVTYREGDDYDHISLQWHDSGLKTKKGGNYDKVVELIADKRIEASNWPKGMAYRTLMVNWKHGKRLRSESRHKAKKMYDELPSHKKPGTFSSFYAKQGEAIYFRYLQSKKIQHKYAGKDSIVALSSGIFRQFLELNSRIVLSALDRGWEPELNKPIREDVQNLTTRVYSQDMLRNLGQTAGDSSFLSNSEYQITSVHLKRFSKSLIRLFELKLYGEGKDAEVTTISIKGNLDLPSFAKTLLDIAVRESILQRRAIDYAPKSHGTGRLPTFSLNKRLAPMGNLGLKMQGRYEISLDEIELAARDTDNFLRTISSNLQPSGQGKLL